MVNALIFPQKAHKERLRLSIELFQLVVRDVRRDAVRLFARFQVRRQYALRKPFVKLNRTQQGIVRVLFNIYNLFALVKDIAFQCMSQKSGSALELQKRKT